MAVHHRRPAALTTLAVLALFAAAGCAEDPADSSATADPPASSESQDASPTTPPAPDEDDTATDPGGAPEDGGDDPAGTAGGAGAPASDWCTSDALTAEITGLDSGAGQRYAALVLTNTSDTACRTEGWPGLQLVAENGEELPTTTVRDDSEEAAQLTVEPGASAWAQLHWTVVPGEDDPADGSCGPDPAGVGVIPPDEYDATDAAWDLGAVCGAGTIEALPLALGSGPGA
ncbi:DUF4232 domain-containing protein [Streptomyces avicenniae]|uniref:DUF4232 domain-containing protein n=1 Tax=Streptomyces avicenniae TaxID=500153 RepID=UPI00069B3DFC|nr:DUF4232 domain-containing protein [Streptomyces avicenniae]